MSLLFFSSLSYFVYSTSGAALESGRGQSIAPVVKLLNDMKKETEEEAKQSRTTYDSVEDQCGLSQLEEKKQIEILQRSLEAENAKKEEASAAVLKSSGKMEAASGALQLGEKKLKQTTSRFTKQKKEFHQADQESAETITMVGHAIQALQKNKTKAMLLQKSGGLEAAETAMTAIVGASSVSLEHQEVFRSLLQSGSWKESAEGEGGDKEEALGMGGIVDMFEKFQIDETAARNTRAQEFSEKKIKMQLLIQQLNNNIANSQAESEREREKKSAAEESHGKADTALTKLSNQLKNSRKTLNDSIMECRQAKEDFNRSQKDFADQLAAINKALEILGKAPDFMQTSSVTSFLQLGSSLESKISTKSSEVSSMSVSALKTKAAILLQRLGTKLESYSLQQLATRVEEDPFQKVSNMIESMISKLEKEQKNEQGKKQYCDREKKVAAKDVGKKNQEADKLSARQEDAEAERSSLKKKNEGLADRIQEITKDVNAQTKERAAENKDNLEVIRVASTNSQACAEAISALQEYFASESSGDEKSLMQMDSRGGNAQTIIYLLQEAEADFSKTLADTKAAESGATETFKKQMQDFRVEKATTLETIKGHVGEMARLGTQIKETEEDLENAEKELNASKTYQEKILDECEVKVPTFEERQERRKTEIQGLREALTILSGEDE